VSDNLGSLLVPQGKKAHVPFILPDGKGRVRVEDFLNRESTQITQRGHALQPNRLTGGSEEGRGVKKGE
jgi:hypothetical protein